MTGAGALEYLRELCRQIDHGIDHARLRKVVATLAIPAVTFTLSCDPPVVYEAYGVPEYGGPFEETSCTNGVDDDDDGRADCDDADCRGEGCSGDCDDGLDDDGDGRVDCLDPDCAGTDTCP